MYCFDIGRGAAVVIQQLPGAVNELGQCRIADLLVGPQGIQQAVPCDGFRVTLQQQMDEMKRSGFSFYQFVVLVKKLTLWIQTKLIETIFHMKIFYAVV